jgi:Subtilase family/Viral BACON domain
MQSDSRPRLGRPQDSQPTIVQPDALPQTYLNPNRLHKLIISDKEGGIYDRLARANAIRNEIDYGSYKLVVVDEEAVGGRAALQAMPVAMRDEQNMIIFNGYLIDTSDSQPLRTEAPEDLKLSRMSEAAARASAPGKGLYVVQFIGPIQDSWFEELEQTGVEIITYAPHNAYVVLAGERAAGELMKMKASSPFVQWMGDYQPAYKLTPGLRAARQGDASRLVRVTVQVIDNAEGELKAGQLRASASQYFGESRVLKYRNLRLEIPVSQLAELARSDEVFAIEEDTERVRLDEAQGQIVAGNLSGNAPTGPGYLAWLAGKGFNSSQFNSFAVNVVDDAASLKGHPDLPNQRVAFENDPTNLGPFQRGHGFLNSHIIGGFNDAAGAAYEDANGFNYGLGIAPWARVGVTAIFGFSPATPTSWEETAYGQGARISSNSWGLIDPSTFLPITRYDVNAQEFDRIVRDAQRGVAGNQQLTVVFAAANSGPSSNTVGSPGSAKNVITVGASENVRMTGVDGCGVGNSGADSANDVIFFSSRGPVNPGGGDGRVKPDILAPGTHIQAGVPQSNYFGGSVCNKYFPTGQTLYSWSSGTSHSTPAVAGGAALVYQDFLNKGMEAPSPAMIKAVLMNSTSYLTGAGAGDTLPSNAQGMGLVNLGRAFDSVPRLLTDQTKTFGSSGQTYNVTGAVASSSQPFRVTLAWTDAPGSTIGGPWVNNLDLEVTINGQVYKGNVFSGPNSVAGGAPDGKNNVESVFLPPGLSGKFLVTVRGVNIAGDGVPGNADPTDQDFALVIYNANAETPDSPIIGFSPASLSFITAAGVNPVNRTVNIDNIGVGTLNWEASADAPWLTVSPAGAAAPSVLTAAVNAVGLSVGTYRATITIRSTNAFNSPVSVPVTLSVVPVFRANPSSLDVIAPLGGGNPQDQIISISHNDGRFRDWIASDDATWLTVNPVSGVAPSQLAASIDITGLRLGVYNGTITIRSTNPSIISITVPVTLTVDAVFNGGFESAVSPWVFSGVAMRSTGGQSHSGAAYLLLGGANSSSGEAHQRVNLPRDSSPMLTFWLNVTSNETAMTPNDKLFIEVCDRSGKTLETLAVFSNLNRSAPGGYTTQGGYSLAQFTGRPVMIRFRTTTDAASVTSFRIDDVSVK